MKVPETIEEFYIHKLNGLPAGYQKGIGHFNVFRTEDCYQNGQPTVHYSRRDFYKVALARDHNRYHFADRSLDIDGSALMFFNPQVPYTFEPVGERQNGIFCIFTESFLSEKIRGSLTDWPMFMTSGKPGYSLSAEEDREVETIFRKMISEMRSDYAYKFDLIGNYVLELAHFAMKRQPTESFYKHPDANSRITSVFMELLERQFPIDSPSQRFSMRSATDYASQLSVHVNHLNRAVKTTTGKTTTSIISERLASEAKALLKHTDWNVSEIGYSLGFEEASHFNNFFKKHTSLTPSGFRNV